LEFNVPFQHKYGYIRDKAVTQALVLVNMLISHNTTQR